MELEALRKDIADTKNLVYDIARSLEKIENVMLPTDYNNNRGVLQVIGEMEARVDNLEKFKSDTELIQKQNEKRFEVNAKWLGLAFAGLVVVQIGLEVYKIVSHK